MLSLRSTGGCGFTVSFRILAEASPGCDRCPLSSQLGALALSAV